MSGVRVDRDRCIGSGQCTIYAPNSFRLGTDAKAHAIHPSGDPREALESAIEACPTGALEPASGQ